MGKYSFASQQAVSVENYGKKSYQISHESNSKTGIAKKRLFRGFSATLAHGWVFIHSQVEGRFLWKTLVTKHTIFDIFYATWEIW